MSLDYPIHGGKGGESKPHTPVETPNNLLSVAYAKVLIAVAEGELAGVPTDQDIFLDGTPLANPDGSKNFGGVKWEWRPGTTDQTYIAGLPEVSTEYNVGVELKSTTPYVRSLTKTALDAMRITFEWPALLQQLSNGDTVGVSLDYKIEISTDGGPFTLYKTYNINGKTNTSYERTHRVDLPKANTGWIVRAVKITADTTSGTIQDTMNVKSVAEVVDVKQRYPNTALLYVEFDSRMFGGGAIPKVSVNTKGRIIRVPANYDPITRSYSGVWNGTFKWAWTDNPAWIYHDIITQDRFGLGDKVSIDMVDKWALYEIAQYCDVLVDDGYGTGGKQPRHTFNVYIQAKQDAWQVLRDIATCFNGMTYWNGNQFTAVADKQEPFNNAPVFSRSNVIDGRFEYQASDDKSIYTSALVSYDDPDNHYNSEIESTFETSQILRWGGDRQIELSAIGCTSRGEAQRRGKYTLLTNMFNRTVSFRTGLQGLNDEVMPGKLIHVVDPLIGGRPFTGRIVVATGTVLTLDRSVQAAAGDIMYITRSNGTTEGRTIASVASNIVTLQVAYTEVPLPNAVWYLEAADLKSQLYRVTKITSPSESVYEIQGVEYNDSKYAAIDTGARLEPRPISVVPPNIQQPPTTVSVSSYNYVEQTMSVNTMVISWNKTQNATSYEVQWKVGNGDWVNVGVTGALEVNVKGIYTGQYMARVRAINASGIKSVWTSSSLTTLNGKTGTPPALTSLTVTPIVFGMRLNWTFAAGVSDTDRTEIMYSPTASFSAATKLGDFAYPQASHEMSGLKAGQQFFFWGRIVDKTGNLSPYYPLTTANGVMGSSSTDLAKYEEYFLGQINESALGQQLAEKIDKIDVIESGLDAVDKNLNWVESQLGAVQDQLKNDISDAVTTVNKDIESINNIVDGLQDQIADIVDALEYDPAKTYVTGDAVRGIDSNRLYQAKKNVPVGTPPPNDEYWQDVGQVITGYGALASQVTVNSATIAQQGDTLTSQAQSITGLTTRIGQAESNISGNTTAISNLSTTVTQQGNTLTAQGQSITALESDVTNLEAGVAGNTTAISGLTTTVTQQGQNIAAIGQDITNLTSEIDFNALDTLYEGKESDAQIADALKISKATATATETLTATVTSQGNTITANSQNIVNLTASLESTTGTVVGNASAIESLKSNVTQQGNQISSQGESITSLDNRVTTAEGNITANTSATSALTTRVTAAEGNISGQATAITNLQTTVAGKADTSAVTALTTRVTTAENNITTQAGQITTLNTTVAGKADTSALNALSTTVTQQGDTLTAQGNAVTQLQSTVGGLGLDPAPDSLWQFDATTEGWTAAGATLAWSAGKVTITSTGSDPTLNSPSGLAITGSLYPKVKIQVTRVAGSGWDGKVFYATSGHGFNSGYYKSIPNPNLTAGKSVVLDVDMTSLTVGGADWINSTINQIRFDLGSTSSDVFTVDWIGVGRDGPSASSSSLSQLNTTVIQQGNTITAQATKLDGIFVQVNPVQAGDTTGYAGDSNAYVGVWSEQSARIEDNVATGQRVDGLTATVGSNTAAISNEATVRANADSALATQQSTTQASVDGLTTTVQQTSSALATLDGKSQAMWSVKLQVNAQGQYVTAGVGLGLENTPGGLQSTFLVNADTFAVVNGVNTTPTAPFVVTGGQVFIKDVMIGNGSITNAKIGSVIQSDNYVFGTSGWAINKSGGFEMNGASAGGRMQLSPTALKFYHPNGVLGIDLSL